MIQRPGSSFGITFSRNSQRIIAQDLESDDHWFALIGSQSLVHLVEHSPKGNNYSETFTLEKVIDLIGKIKLGHSPERFYGIKSKNHTFRVISYERFGMTREQVGKYLV